MGNTIQFRDAAFDAIERAMDLNPDIVVLTNDMGALGLDSIAKAWPDRAINVGIAEQNMISVAAGMALAGKIAFCYGIVAHIVGRCYEQIRNDVCCPGLPVVLVGVGSGLAYGNDGPTHHGVHDIAALRPLPNIAIYDPSDATTTELAIADALRRRGPGYVRLDKEAHVPLYGGSTDIAAGMLVHGGPAEAVLISSGFLSPRALAVLAALAARGRAIRVIDLVRLKPVDAPALLAAIGPARAVVTIEENAPVGGLGSLVGDMLARQGRGVAFNPIALDADHYMLSATREWAHARSGLTEAAIAASIEQALARQPRAAA
ncbi:MAG: transketolase C-terminal domain-containing protein [Alphaproteobacteria bacterium]